MSEEVLRSLKRLRKEREKREYDRMTTLQRAETNRGEDVVLLILLGNALVMCLYVLFEGTSGDLVWAAVLCLVLALVMLMFRFKRPLSPKDWE